MSNNPILVEVMRGGVLESFHRGVICVVDKDGKTIYSEGDIQQMCYPRSALKFFQHIPLIESGAFEHYGFTMEELAIMCGSHNGEDEHVRVTMQILEKIGLYKEDLLCGAQAPTLSADRRKLAAAGKKPEKVHNNCSGKHAGFLAYAKFIGSDISTYTDPNHPIQQEILQVAADFHEYPKENMAIGIDGCSAPIFAIPVYNQAVAYKNLIHPVQFSEKRQKACAMIIEAITSYPFMVAGSQRYCTDMMEICGKRIIGKTGAEGIYSLGFLEEKIGCSIKIDDGKMLPQYNVAEKVIEQTGIFTQAELAPLAHYKQDDIKNYANIVTGEIRVSDRILSEPLIKA